MARRDDVGGAGGPAGIEVDLAGLYDFATQVRGEVEKSVRPQVGDVFTLFRAGVCFGHGLAVSPVVQAARVRYHGSLDSTGQSLAAFVNTADAMVKAVEEIADRYGNADWFARATAEEVSAAFTRSVPPPAGTNAGQVM